MRCSILEMNTEFGFLNSGVRKINPVIENANNNTEFTKYVWKYVSGFLVITVYPT
jgi:hypothetical protein